MATISEDYVSFETSKLLKEKGFDFPCMGRYSVRSKEFHLDCTRMCSNEGLFECAAPSQAMAMKWLREVHNWNVVIRKSHTIYGYDIYIESLVASNVIEYAFEKTYEQACEAAILYCLENLI